MITWMLYTVLVGLFVVVAAAAGDSVARLYRLPVRFVWLGAAAICTILPVTARLRMRAVAPDTARSIDLSSLALVQTSIQTVGRHMSASAGWYALGIWGFATVLVVTAFGMAYMRLHRSHAAWPEVDFLGHRVRVSPSCGPIVIGFVRPKIVVPQWVLHCSAAEQRLILDHELGHVRARDPIVLGVASALVGLMPWNPALWIVLSRVRLAVELDCDARVLRGGVSPRSYGSLLVDVAERASAMRFAAIALSDRSSHLRQRILAMQSSRTSHPIARGVTVALVGAAALLAACEAKMPTAADIDHMDAVSAERSARQLTLRGDSVIWFVDGKAASEAEAKAIPRDSIANLSVNTVAGPVTLRVNTLRARQIGLATTSGDEVRGGDHREPSLVDGKINPAGALHDAIVNEKPLLLIDGVRSDLATLKAIERSRIASVEIVKGKAARQVYGDAGRNGVIVVTTKAPGGR